METLNEILSFEFIKIGEFSLNLIKIFSVVLIVIGARVIFFLLYRLILARFYRRRKIDTGRKFAINRMIKYSIYLLAILMAIRATGIELTLIWAGGAALLAGIALGMQNTFADLVGGIILLIEGKVEVGDVVIVDEMVGTVKTIGLRTSQIETLDTIMKIVPNSKLVSENVTNWSSGGQLAPFHVKVGVSYKSDVTLVTSLLIQAAQEHRDVVRKPQPKVIFKDFGNSSLDFELYFFSSELLRIEFIKSEIRYRVVELFRENKVEIPCPQRDVWFKNAEILFGRGNP